MTTLTLTSSAMTTPTLTSSAMTTPTPNLDTIIDVTMACRAFVEATASYEGIPEGLYNPYIYHKAVPVPARGDIDELMEGCWKYILTGERGPLDDAIRFITVTLEDDLPFATAIGEVSDDPMSPEEDLAWSIEFIRAKYDLFVKTGEVDYLTQTFWYITNALMDIETIFS